MQDVPHTPLVWNTTPSARGAYTSERYETLAARGTPMHAVGPVGTVLAPRRCGVSWDPEMKAVTSTSATAKTTFHRQTRMRGSWGASSGTYGGLG